MRRFNLLHGEVDRESEEAIDIGIFDVPEPDDVIVRRSANVDYWDGELRS